MIKSTDYVQPCNCRSVGECFHNVGAELEAFTALIVRFGDEMKKKLCRKMSEGYWGWDEPEIRDRLLAALRDHVEKGDMVDVANLAMFIWNLEN